MSTVCFIPVWPFSLGALVEQPLQVVAVKVLCDLPTDPASKAISVALSYEPVERGTCHMAAAGELQLTHVVHPSSPYKRSISASRKQALPPKMGPRKLEQACLVPVFEGNPGTALPRRGWELKPYCRRVWVAWR